MSVPRFTVITPSYNQGEFIGETIESVLSQDYPNIEFIIIDGNSSDSTQTVIQEYIGYIDYYLSEADSGQSEAINKGLKVANGEYIMWLNSDDILLPGSISTAVGFFQSNPSADVIHGQSWLFGSVKQERRIGTDKGDWGPYYTAYMSFPQPSSFFTKRLIEGVGRLDETLHYGMDFDLYLRAHLVSEVAYVPHVFSRYRIHSGSKSTHTLCFVKDWQEVFSRFINSIPDCQDIRMALLRAGLHTGTGYHYAVTKGLLRSDVERSVALHLEVLAHAAYQHGEKPLFFKCVNFLKHNFPEFYRRNDIFNLEARNLLLPYRVRSILKSKVFFG